MATTGSAGPIFNLRVDGKGEHDVGTFEWGGSKPKEPFTQIGKEVADRYTSAPKSITWSCEAVSRPDGSFAIPWEELRDLDKVFALVASTSGRTERLLGACVDEVSSSYDRESGRWTKSISGKAFDHKYG